MVKAIAKRITDFKSYKGHHTLLFGDSYFTSIIGPNGSGKSNSYVIISVRSSSAYLGALF
jgi:structural maintenance of chromosome 1